MKNKKKAQFLNDTTAAAIEEGKQIAHDKTVKGYTNMEELKAALEK